MTATELLLIIILCGGPDDQPGAQALADAIRQQATQPVEVVVGAERLETFGISYADISARPTLASHLTRSQPQVILIDVDFRRAGSGNEPDQILAAKLWIAGAYDVYTTIAGKGGDPQPAFIAGVIPLLRGHIGSQVSPVASVSVPVATLVERRQWTRVLTALAAQGGPQSAIDHFYQVTAYSELNHRQAALESLNQMRQAYGGHFLVTAAADALPPVSEAPVVDTLDQEAAEAGQLQAEQVTDLAAEIARANHSEEPVDNEPVDDAPVDDESVDEVQSMPVLDELDQPADEPAVVE